MFIFVRTNEVFSVTRFDSVLPGIC